MITYDYKYTEIELEYADLENGEIKCATIEIKGHRKQRNKKFIRKQLEAQGIKAKDYLIKSVLFRERQYKMEEKDFMKVATPSLF